MRAPDVLVLPEGEKATIDPHFVTTALGVLYIICVRAHMHTHTHTDASHNEQGGGILLCSLTDGDNVHNIMSSIAGCSPCVAHLVNAEILVFTPDTRY